MNQLASLFGNKVFSNPKPIQLVEKCIKISLLNGSYIMDYFAGSGTTGHSLLKAVFK